MNYGKFYWLCYCNSNVFYGLSCLPIAFHPIWCLAFSHYTLTKKLAKNCQYKVHVNKLKFEHKTKEVNKLGWIWIMYFVIAWSIFTRKVVDYFLKIENDSTTLLLNFKTMIFCLQKKINKENNERSESKANENFLKKGGWLVSGGFISSIMEKTIE